MQSSLVDQRRPLKMSSGVKSLTSVSAGRARDRRSVASCRESFLVTAAAVESDAIVSESRLHVLPAPIASCMLSHN